MFAPRHTKRQAVVQRSAWRVEQEAATFASTIFGFEAVGLHEVDWCSEAKEDARGKLRFALHNIKTFLKGTAGTPAPSLYVPTAVALAFGEARPRHRCCSTSSAHTAVVHTCICLSLVVRLHQCGRLAVVDCGERTLVYFSSVTSHSATASIHTVPYFQQPRYMNQRT